MDNNELKEKFKFRIAISKIQDEINSNVKSSKAFVLRKSVIAASVCLVLTSGIVFAKDIRLFIKNRFGLGAGVSTSIEEGKIIESQIDFIESNMNIVDVASNTIIDNIKIKSKINSSIVVQNNIGLEFYFEFDSKLNEYIDLGKIVNNVVDYENSHFINFKDLFIFDDKNNIIFTTQSNAESINNYCTMNNLDYSNINIIESNLSSSIKSIDTTDSKVIKLILETTITSNQLDKFNSLNISFSSLNFVPKISNNHALEIDLNSDKVVNFNIEIPNFLYNTNESSYIVTKCESNEIKIIDAKVNDTGFHLAFTLLNAKKSVYPPLLEEIEKEIPAGFISKTREEFVNHYGEEYTKLYEEYYENVYIIKYNGTNPFIPWIKSNDGCYVQNSNGEKFYKSINQTITSPAFDNLPENTYYDIYDMTNYNSTDKITVVINYKNQPIHIELEKRGY